MTPKADDASDAVVIGASAAGLFAADRLARHGLRVRLFDAATAPPAARTLIVTRHVLDALGFEPDGAVVNRIHRFDLFSRSRRSSVALAAPDLVVERGKILRILADRALNAGVDVRFGHQLVDVDTDGRGATITVRDVKRDRVERVRTRRVIGADGVASRVARAFGMPRPPAVPLFQAIVDAPRDLAADVTQVWFDTSETPYFYWVIADAPGRASVGLIGTEGRRAHASLERFLAARGLRARELQAGRIPLSPRRPSSARSVGGADVFLVGDAAGHVKITTVGGLVTGLAGARAVADAIVDGVPYARRLRALHRELAWHRRVRTVLDRFRDDDYDHLLSLMDGRTTAILGTTTRDELATTFARLVVTQPRLLWFGRRLLAGRSDR